MGLPDNLFWDWEGLGALPRLGAWAAGHRATHSCVLGPHLWYPDDSTSGSLTSPSLTNYEAVLVLSKTKRMNSIMRPGTWGIEVLREASCPHAQEEPLMWDWAPTGGWGRLSPLLISL